MDFLGRIGPLLTDVQIELGRISPKRLENLRTALTNSAHFLCGGIRSVWCSDQHPLPVVAQCLGNKFANAKVLKISGLGNGLFFIHFLKLIFRINIDSLPKSQFSEILHFFNHNTREIFVNNEITNR